MGRAKCGQRAARARPDLSPPPAYDATPYLPQRPAQGVGFAVVRRHGCRPGWRALLGDPTV